MAIASGVPIPYCAIIDESSINAFVVGGETQDIYITVTAGALKKLSRDQLQAIVGHEFSHILHEDLKLNTQLASVVLGFQFISKAGNTLMQRLNFEGTSNTREYREYQGLVFLLGFGLSLVGFLGNLLGQVIQSLIARQREYLADASSVQYTRNPEALAISLGKILMGGGSFVRATSSMEFAHIFFASPFGSSYLSFFNPSTPSPENPSVSY